MKATIMAAAAAVLAGTASASHGHRHEHKNLFARGVFDKKGNDTEVCVPGCTTIYTTITGPGGLYTPPATATPSVKPSVKPSLTAKVSTTAAVTTAKSSSTPPAVVPTPIAQTCPTPGTYTFPATTIVVTETTTVCAASTTKVPSGTHTLGGVTTVVTTATTVVCPYATTKTESGVVTSVIETTTYVCPSAGTYTIAPVTVTVTDTETVCAVPVVSTFHPGTYTAPAVVTTIVETDTVVYCPFTEVEAVPTSTPVPATSTPALATTTPVAATSSTAEAPVASSSTPASSGSTPSLGGTGDHWAITYTPYSDSGACKSASEVLSDITAIKAAGFSSVRIYSTDCDTLPNVGAACEAVGLKIIAGIFVSEVGCDNASPHVADQISALKAWSQWNLVELMVVANEAVFNGYCTVSELKELIVQVKSELSSVGYTGPITTTDVVSAWLTQGMSDLCSVIDVVACNAHAYFNGAVLPEAAGAFVAGQLALVEAVCGLSGYVVETGWPHAGNCIGDCCPGESQQSAAIGSIKDTMGSKAVFFSFSDDAWKQPGDCGCENSWGMGSLFGA